VVFIFFLRILGLLRAGLALYYTYGSFDAIVPKLCTGLEAVLRYPKLL